MKKAVLLDGYPVLPLKEGRKAVIASNGNLLFTSPVVEIIENEADFIHFETMNAIYRVTVVPSPIEAALQRPLPMCA